MDLVDRLFDHLDGVQAAADRLSAESIGDRRDQVADHAVERSEVLFEERDEFSESRSELSDDVTAEDGLSDLKERLLQVQLKQFEFRQEGKAAIDLQVTFAEGWENAANPGGHTVHSVTDRSGNGTVNARNSRNSVVDADGHWDSNGADQVPDVHKTTLLLERSAGAESTVDLGSE